MRDCHTFVFFQVETIGDAYMVVSGLPIRNGHAHAEQIADLSLHLLRAVQEQFIIRHMPDTKLQIRIGLHSGIYQHYAVYPETISLVNRIESPIIKYEINIYYINII